MRGDIKEGRVRTWWKRDDDIGSCGRYLTTIIYMKHLTRVRQMRKHQSLTQDELADLLGVNQGSISRLESGTAPPDLETAFGLQVIFGGSLHDLFPALFEKIEDAVMRRAAKLDRALADDTHYDAAAKRRLLKGMVFRARAKHQDI